MFMDNPMPPSTIYHVAATSLDGSHAHIETRGHELSLNVKKGRARRASTPLRRCLPR